MFIETTKTFLTKALSSVIQVVTDSRLPVLASIRIDATAILEVNGTNLQNHVTALVDESVIKAGGCVCVPGKAFFDIIKALPEDRVDLKLNAGRLVITSGGARFGIAVADPNDFPKIPRFPKECVSINREEFFETISKTLFCASRDETAPHLCAVLFNDKEAVSTDRHRLSMVAGTPLPIDKGHILITRETLGFITKIFKEDDLEFARTKNTIHFRNRSVIYTANLIAEEFPDYRQVLPKGPAAGIKIAREGFEKVIERAALVNPDGTLMSFEVLEGTNGRVTVSASADLGDSEESFPASIMNLPGKVDIRVRPFYLIEAMKALSSDTVLFELRDAVTPLMVLGGTHVQAIMPIR